MTKTNIHVIRDLEKKKEAKKIYIYIFAEIMTSIFFQTYDKREPTYSKNLKTTGRINPKTSIHGTREVRGHRGFREKSSYRTCG